MTGGVEWLVDARGCRAEALRDPSAIEALFRRIVAELCLHPIGEPIWHRFPGPGGVTAVWLLSESHIACHTFPEHGSACINLFCCRLADEHPMFDWVDAVRESLGGSMIKIRAFERDYTSGREAPSCR